MPKTLNEDEAQLTENLTIKSVGYLKAPEAFKTRYPGWLNAPTPTASLKIKDGKVVLSYTWDKDSLENAKPDEKPISPTNT